MASTNLLQIIHVIISVIFLTRYLEVGNSLIISTEMLYNLSTTFSPFDVYSNETGIENTTSSFPLYSSIENDSFLEIQPPATDGSFDYEMGPDWDKLNPGDVELYLNRPDTMEYINSFPHEQQRYLIKETLRYCPYMQLCNFSLGLKLPPMGMFNTAPCCEYCSCYPDCVKTKSCCPDYKDIQLQHVANSDLNGEAESCMPTELTNNLASKTHDGNYFLAVQTCPPNTDPHLSHQCSREYHTIPEISLEDITPLSDNIRNKTYRNKHCAVCNGADIKELFSWELKLNCPSPPELSNINNLLTAILGGKSQCIIQLLSPMSTEVSFCSHLIEICNETGLWTDFDPFVKSACNLYESAISLKYENTTYQFKNPFCAICNGLIPNEYICEQEIFDPGSPFPFSGLLSYTATDSNEEDISSTCDRDYMFDDITNTCRKVTCSPYRTFKKDHCEVFLESTDTAGYRLTSLLIPSVSIGLEDVYVLMPSILSEVEDIIQMNSMFYICTKQILLIATNGSKDSNGDLLLVDSIELQFDIMSQNEHNIAVSIDLLLGIDGLVLKRNVNKSNNDIITFTILLKDEIPYISIPHEFYSNWSIPNTTPVDLQELLWFSFSNEGKTVVPYFNWNPMFGPCISQTKIYQLLSLQTCVMFTLNLSEFGLSETEHGIRFEHEEEIVLRLSDYFYDNSTSEINICVDTYKRAFERFKKIDIASFSAELIVSIICVSVSIVCLLISLITYCAIPQLQTLPGKNNMALIVALLTAQGVYIIGSYAGFEPATIECKLIGGLTHFFWLLSIFWMNACTLHMFRVLLQTRDMAHSNSSMKHFQYHIYCILSSTVFVLANILVSMTTSDYTDIGYGKDRCYISEQRMVEFTFGIPAGIVIIANISMFVAIIIKLKRTPTVSKNVKHERNYFFIFAKLSTITGATWLFGFLYMWTGVIAFSYIFIILNGGQGLFLMLAFVFNKRTFALMTNRREILTTSIFGRTQSTKVSTKSNDRTTKQEQE